MQRVAGALQHCNPVQKSVLWKRECAMSLGMVSSDGCCFHRIGIDTGAYRSGCLTALVLEGTERRVIQAVERDGVITIEHSTCEAGASAR